LRAGESTAVARVDDLDALAATSIGKIEIEAIEDGREGAVFDALVRQAVLEVFRDRVDPTGLSAVVEAFEEGAVAHTGSDVPSAELASLVESVAGLATPVSALCDGSDDPAEIAAAVEFILEGLHLSRRLNKDASGSAATYRAR